VPPRPAPPQPARPAPAATPAAPQARTPAAPAARPAPPTPAPGPPTNSTTSQPNSRSTTENSPLNDVLARLRTSQAQTAQQSTPRPAAPPRGGAPGGGSPTGIDNGLITAATRGAIADKLHECWTKDAAAQEIEKQVVHLRLTTDEQGVIRQAELIGTDASRVGVARAFAERARRAALDPVCSRLPLPAAVLGQIRTFDITYRP